MPESKHRRKGNRRPRPQDAAGPPVKPKPSPPWVSATGIALLLVGVAVVIGNYISAARNWILLVGFAAMAAGFGFLMRWR
ncbi:MAG: cell division protein CrgA [Nitriliruptorales bacterium]